MGTPNKIEPFRIVDDDLRQIADWNTYGAKYTPPTHKKVIAECLRKYAMDRHHFRGADAVCAWDGCLTFGELYDLASRLATLLHPVDRGSFVPICFGQSMWYVVTIVAVLLKGGVVVPIDPGLPIERKKMIRSFLNMEEMYGPKVFDYQHHRLSLCGPSLTDVMSEVFGSILAAPPRDPDELDDLDGLDHPDPVYDETVMAVEQMLIDKHTIGIDQFETSIPYRDTMRGSQTHSGGPAVLMFTWDNNNVQGVVLSREKTYCSAAEYHGRATSVDLKSRVLELGAHDIGVSIAGMLTTLLQGGCVCIASEEDRLNDPFGALKRLRANHLHLTPSMARRLDPAALSTHVETVVFSGNEPLSQQILDSWFPYVHVFQAYTPSTTGVTATIKSHMKPHDSPNDFGRPSGCSIWITDPSDPNILLPIGAVGEILIEGPMISRPYHHEEDDSSSRRRKWDKEHNEVLPEPFIEDPVWVKSMIRLPCGRKRRFLRTGDLGRYIGPRGNIEIVSWSDFHTLTMAKEVEEVETIVGKANNSAG